MKKDRDRSIDMLKTLLVIGMILGHCIQLIGNSSIITRCISDLINLITFSGFLFCFGYAVSITYLDKNKNIIGKKLIKNCTELLIVFYLSGVGYTILVNKEFSISKLIKILTLSHIPGYSEFLASFLVLNIFTLIFFNQIKKIIECPKYIVIILVFSLLLTFIPYEYITINQIGLIIGSTQFPCFPILQYCGYYILGMYFQRYKIIFTTRYFILSAIATGIFIKYVMTYKEIPSRFPPSIFWIIGAAGIIYIYYLVSIFLATKINKNNKLYFIGENTLYFLLGSNIILFYLNGIYNVKLNFKINLIVSMLIIILCYILIYIVRNMKVITRSVNIKKIMNRI